MYGSITNSWLNINRHCNLSCKWCYAKDAFLDEMSLTNVDKILNFLIDLNVMHITLLGGEPTCHGELVEIVKLASKRGIQTTLVTNGIKLSDRDYLDKLIDSGIGNIGLSLKGYDEKSFKENTFFDCYAHVMTAINNISNAKVPFSISYVLDKNNISLVKNGIIDAKRHGAYSFSFSFCYHFEAQKCNECLCDNPHELAFLFDENYEELNVLTEGNMILFQTLPLCSWRRELISLMEERNQLRSICQAQRKSGLIFDTDLSIIPCNAMYELKLGKFDTDFSNKKTFLDFWNRDYIVDIYDRLRSVPDKECLFCEQYVKCGGGCNSNWFNYSFKEFKEMMKNGNIG